MVEQKICCIFGAGDYFGDEFVPQGAAVIAADAGVTRCRAMHIEPDVIIGDFDSLGCQAQGKRVITLPVVKDDTDTMAAVKYALEAGHTTILLFGCTGGRLSHTVANLQTLVYIAKRGATGILFDKEEAATATCKGLYFDSKSSGFISVFAAESHVTVSESGLKYTLDKGVLHSDFPLGVSNEFIGTDSRIQIHDGVAVVITKKEVLR